MSYTTFIQWKGTDLCMDFNCPACGASSHYDGFFGYAVECSGCKAHFRMPSEIGPLLERIQPGEETSVLRDGGANEDHGEIEGDFVRVDDAQLLASYKLK